MCTHTPTKLRKRKIHTQGRATSYSQTCFPLYHGHAFTFSCSFTVNTCYIFNNFVYVRHCLYLSHLHTCHYNVCNSLIVSVIWKVIRQKALYLNFIFMTSLAQKTINCTKNPNNSLVIYNSKS